MKITVLYVSVTGNTEKMAGYIRDGIEETDDMEVRLMNLNQKETVDFSFVKDSSAIIIGTPAYVADMSWQLKKWFDTDWNCNLAGKLGAAFATANCMHGGADLAISSVLRHMLVKGIMVYSSGAGCGRPFIHLGPVALKDDLDGKRELFQLFGKRIAQKAVELFGEK
ncbi:MAG: flavodoxin family protein [Bacillota bacterium]|jgi:NAD(P)H dehydrogenase (quinone)